MRQKWGVQEGGPSERKAYLMMLQVPFGIGLHVPYFFLCVFQLLLYKLTFLVNTEAYHMVRTFAGSGFTLAS